MRAWQLTICWFCSMALKASNDPRMESTELAFSRPLFASSKMAW